MARVIRPSKPGKQNDNIIWITEDVSTVEGFQDLFYRLHELQKEDKVPWILLNISCVGTENAYYANAALTLLQSATKPIKTQIITEAQSFGLIYACLGEERKAWPHAFFMHHSYQLVMEASLEEAKKIVTKWEKEEKIALEFMKSQMGPSGYSAFITDFKKNSSQDMNFNSQKAVAYGIVQEIGIIEPFFY